MALGSHCDHWLHLRGHPSVCHPRHGHYVLRRLLQAGGRLADGCHHRQQERMGLRIRRIHYAVGDQGWICASNHDEHESHYALVPVRYLVLLLWQDVQKVVEEQLST